VSEQIKPLQWIDFYQSALLEVDHAKLAGYLEAADIAIRERLQALTGEPAASQERQAIRDAQQNLRVLYEEIAAAARYTRAESHSHPEMSGDYVACVDATRHYVAVTDGVCELLGYSRAELLRKSIDEVTAPEIRATVPETFDHYVAQGSMEGVFALVAKDGHRVAIQYQARVFPDGCMVARWHPLESFGEPAA
jgi:PAS domain S-box-containing protein